MDKAESNLKSIIKAFNEQSPSEGSKEKESFDKAIQHAREVLEDAQNAYEEKV